MKIFALTLTLALSCCLGDYPRNPHVAPEVWTQLTPYFLPYNSDARPQLDAIFSEKRVTASVDTIREAGFMMTETQGTRVTAVRHPSLPGYVLKIYPDDKATRVDWVSWSNRIIGSRLLKKSIRQRRYTKLFKVPNKWIYPLPAEPSPAAIVAEGGRKNFILVVEDVSPLPRQQNWRRWRHLDNRRILKALVDIVHEVGAGDCVRANNLPWCRDGKVALVDTEIYYRWPIRYHPLIEVLSHSMRPYWRKLTKNRTEKPDQIVTLP